VWVFHFDSQSVILLFWKSSNSIGRTSYLSSEHNPNIDNGLKQNLLGAFNVHYGTLRQLARSLLKALTPADEAHHDAGWRSLECVRYEAVQVQAFTEHPEIAGTCEVNLHK